MQDELSRFYDAEHTVVAQRLMPPFRMVVANVGNNSRIPVAIFGAEGEQLLLEFLKSHEGDELELTIIDCSADEALEMG